ncbi:MAG: RNA polymerase sigma factor [Candidatus Limnocylindria bacterium]
MDRSDSPRQRLEALFIAHHAELLAFVRRRGAEANAEDLVADSFVVAWRRLDDIPAGNERAWLFGVARRVLANARRGQRRGMNAVERLAADPPSSPAVETGVSSELTAALASLREADREVLTLAAWEELTPAEIGVVLGITPNAASIRLHRARARFASALKHGVKESRCLRTWSLVRGSPKQRRETEHE